jgi:hypothetical protein
LALLNLGKKKAEEQPPQDVPDELPDLPEAAENSPEAVPAGSGSDVPDELPPVDGIPESELAPDELPPVTQVDSAPEAAQVDDQRLYFSQLLQKFHEEGLKSTKITTPSVNLVSDMKKNWKKLRKAEEAALMNRKVAENIAPLQRLEQEWMSIQEDIESKKNLLRDKEEEIRKLSEELRQTAQKAEKMNSNQK